MVIKRKTYDSSSDTECGGVQRIEVVQPNREVCQRAQANVCRRYDQCCGVLLLGGLTGIFIWKFWPTIS